MTWWSNCLIEGLRHKLLAWNNVQLKPFFCIDGKLWKFHLMWLDRHAGCVKHFTHHGLDGKPLSDWFFKGHIESKTIAQYNLWCMKKGKLHLLV